MDRWVKWVAWHKKMLLDVEPTVRAEGGKPEIGEIIWKFQCLEGEMN